MAAVVENSSSSPTGDNTLDQMVATYGYLAVRLAAAFVVVWVAGKTPT